MTVGRIIHLAAHTAVFFASLTFSIVFALNALDQFEGVGFIAGICLAQVIVLHTTVQFWLSRRISVVEMWVDDRMRNR